jgi:hypothetical protein
MTPTTPRIVTSRDRLPGRDQGSQRGYMNRTFVQIVADRGAPCPACSQLRCICNWTIRTSADAIASSRSAICWCDVGISPGFGPGQIHHAVSRRRWNGGAPAVLAVDRETSRSVVKLPAVRNAGSAGNLPEVR